jgi:hypothetical protein
LLGFVFSSPYFCYFLYQLCLERCLTCLRNMSN